MRNVNRGETPNNTYLGNSNIKRDGVIEEWTKESILEYKKCSEDPIYFIEKYIKVINLDDGLVPFRLYDYQKEMLSVFHDNRFSIALCSRQIGKTISVASYLLWYALFHSNKTVAILANKGDTAREILSRITLALENIPFFLQPGCKVLNKGSIAFSNNTKLVARSTSSSSIRGMSCSIIYLDEFAFVNNAETFYTSTYPVISSGKTTKIIITSTANGMGNPFHTLWTGAVTKSNEYTPVSVDWRRVPGRTEEWKRETIRNSSERQFSQEHENFFLGTGNTLIDGNKLMMMSAQKPIYENEEKTLRIYREPVEDHDYVMSVDVAKGRGQDYSTFSIIDITTRPFEQVAVFRDNDISPLLYSSVIFKYATQYNNAYTIIESNDNGAMVANSLIQDMEYENVFSEIKAKKHVAGLEMNRRTKSVGCSTLKDLIEQNQLLLYDKETIKELTTFVTKGNSFAASGTNHDDMVMSCVIFAWLSSTDFFQSLTDINIREEMFRKQMDNLQDELAPIGILGSNDPSNDFTLDHITKINTMEEFAGQMWQEIS
jgi:hypothetical protein